ncbi:MAG: polyribonucleotide nucleotidyltransferase, partial [Deltaproteobacteria bacterium]
MAEIFSTEFAGKTVQFKTNYLAQQTDGSILASYGDTVVLVTAVSLREKREGVDFFPLTVDYQEMTFAAGKIPGGFFKREGRPNEKETLTSRMIDRSIRPLFPDGYCNETQIVATVLSIDNNYGPDAIALAAASASLMISDIPFGGPIAACRVCRVNDALLCNPSPDDVIASDINIFLTGRKGATGADGKYSVDLVMLEGDTKEAQEEDIISAIKYGLEQLRPMIDLQDKMRAEIGKAKREIDAVVVNEALVATIKSALIDEVKSAYSIARKQERYAKLDDLKKKAVALAVEQDSANGKDAVNIFEDIKHHVLRDKIMMEGKRIDGRLLNEIRPISSEIGLLPRVHGSALFTRGETQALAAMTLGTSSDEQRLDYISGEEIRTFILHYNFPPYSVGEARPQRSPGRREIGHGN